MIKDFGEDCKTMGEIFVAERNRLGSYLGRVHAPNASVTFLKDNQIKFTIVVNLLTGEVYVAYEKGIFVANIRNLKDESSLTKRVIFRNDDESESMLCYNAKGKYDNNLQGTHLRLFPLDTSVEKPLGPLRFAYLIDMGKDKSISVIAHNGEKIQEALPNIAMAFFSSGELLAFKFFCDREYHEARAGKLLTPVLQNSLYPPGLMINTGLRLKFLNNHEYPSQFRDTTVIISAHNEPALAKMLGMVDQGFAMRIV